MHLYKQDHMQLYYASVPIKVSCTHSITQEGVERELVLRRNSYNRICLAGVRASCTKVLKRWKNKRCLCLTLACKYLFVHGNPQYNYNILYYAPHEKSKILFWKNIYLSNLKFHNVREGSVPGLYKFMFNHNGNTPKRPSWVIPDWNKALLNCT